MALIANGKNTPINENTGGVPNVGDALLQWFQPMVFGIVTKTNGGASTNFRVVEKKESVDFLGVWQPFTDRQLMMKPEGERQWPWFTCHAAPTLVLQTDSIITYLGEQFRVMSQRDYSLYGYVEYHLIKDFTGSGPTEVTP